MDLRDLKIQKFTYKELAEALTDLQFIDESTETAFRFTHKPTGAIILLRKEKQETIVKPVYYADIVFRLIWHQITVYKKALIDIINVNRLKKEQLSKAMGINAR